MQSVALGIPVDTYDVSILLLEFMSFYSLAPILLIEVDFMIIGTKGNLSTIPIPGVTGDLL